MRTRMETPTASIMTSGPQQTEIARLLLAAHAVGDGDHYRAKRRWPRYFQATPLETRRPAEPDSHARGVSMHTISGGGVSFMAREQFEPDDPLLVREWSAQGDRPWLKARVVYRAPGLGGDLIGVAWDEPLSEHECRQIELAASAAPVVEPLPQRRAGAGYGYVVMGVAAVTAVLWLLIELPR